MADQLRAFFQRLHRLPVLDHGPGVEIEQKSRRRDLPDQITCLPRRVDIVRAVYGRVRLHADRRLSRARIITDLLEEADPLLPRLPAAVVGEHPVLWAAKHKVCTACCHREIHGFFRVVQKSPPLGVIREQFLRPAKPDRLHRRNRKAFSRRKRLPPPSHSLQIPVGIRRKKARGRDLQPRVAIFTHQGVNARVLTGVPRNV